MKAYVKDRMFLIVAQRKTEGEGSKDRKQSFLELNTGKSNVLS